MKLVQAALFGAAMSLASIPAIAGDAAAGEAAYASKGCVGCHGAGGNSQQDVNPNLAGQHAAYLTKQMKAFKAGTRTDPTMNAMAAMLSDADMENISAYLSAQK
jgi:cytochrome c553